MQLTAFNKIGEYLFGKFTNNSGDRNFEEGKLVRNMIVLLKKEIREKHRELLPVVLLEF